ncbi:MAG TPA: hypothetical protein VNR67_04065, partial [Solirubrobacterales bacterium]|nr:hypothetical protein [Solirubrobacterales bacterium]
LGPAARRPPQALEAHRLDDAAGEGRALLLRSPEPLDPRRVQATLKAAAERLRPGDPPGPVKIVAAAWDGTVAGERVELLTRETVDLGGWTLEQRAIPVPMGAGEEVLFAARLGGPASGNLLLEKFEARALDAYELLDQGHEEGPGAWSLRRNVGSPPEAWIEQASNVWGDDPAEVTPDKPGTVALTGSPTWADVRIRARLLSRDDDAIGLVFRWRDPANWYRFSMDAERGYRRLVACVDGTVEVLWEQPVGYEREQAHELVVEAAGERLIGRLDGMALFDVRHGAHREGRVGYYCWANQGARFEALRVETLSGSPLLWEQEDLAGLERVVADGVAYSLLGEEDWEDVELAARVAVAGGERLGLILRWRGPDDHYRMALDLTTGERRLERMTPAGAKLLYSYPSSQPVALEHELSFSAVGPRLRFCVDGEALITWPEAGIAAGRAGFFAPEGSAARFFAATVGDRSARAGEFAMRELTGGAGQWTSGGGGLRQGDARAGNLIVPGQGTVALAEAGPWTDTRLVADLRSSDGGAIGVVFRWRDARNHYRFSVDRARNVRRLQRMLDGNLTTLWEAQGGYELSQGFTLTIDAVGSKLVGYLDSTLLFSENDSSHPEGRAGVLSWLDGGLLCERFEVRRAPLDARRLMGDAFPSTAGWTMLQEGGDAGTVAMAGIPTWRDVALRVRLRGSGGPIGAAVRHATAKNSYRFTMSADGGYRRLVKSLDGTLTTLWEDATGYERGREYELVLVAEGEELHGYLDGLPLFAVRDGQIPFGSVGLTGFGSPGTSYADVRVLPAGQALPATLLDERFAFRTRRRWRFAEQDGTAGGPAKWTVAEGELRQSTPLAATGAAPRWAPGALALAGGEDWSDYRLALGIGASTGAGPLGAVVRCTGPGDFYGVSLTPGGGRRLVRSKGGAVTVLWEDAGPYDATRAHLLAIDCLGDRIAVHLDGRRLCAVRDGALAAGGAGPYCSGNADARFTEAIVTPARWSPLYRFGAERRTPAGTRIA